MPVEELTKAVQEQRLALLPVERLLGADQRYSQQEIAEQSGLELDYLQATRRALGLPVPPPDAQVLGEKDLEAAKIGARLKEAGFDDEGMLESTRVLGRGMARYAEAIRTLGASSLLAGGSDERELGRRFAAAAEALLPLTGPWLEYVFALHLRQVLRTDAVTFEEMTTGPPQPGPPAGRRVRGPRRLHRARGDRGRGGAHERRRAAVQAGRRGGRAAGARGQGDRRRGDARRARAGADGRDHARPRRGAPRSTSRCRSCAPASPTGPAVNRWGDWFGSTVNVASRLTARARPGSVLTTEEVRDAAQDGFAWSSAGPKRLKGISEPVKTYRVRREPDA